MSNLSAFQQLFHQPAASMSAPMGGAGINTISGYFISRGISIIHVCR